MSRTTSQRRHPGERRQRAQLAGETDTAINEFRAAAARTANLRERSYLSTKAARLATDRGK